MGSHICVQRMLFVILILVAVSISVACSDSSPGLEPKSSIPSLVTPAGDLDANTIVAAQEQVMGSIYDTVLPSVVHIRVSHKMIQGDPIPSFPDIPGFKFDFDWSSPLPDGGQEFYERGEGSGFVWDNQGHIVTNNHVVEDAERVTVIFADGEEFEAEVVGTDPDSDLAVLVVEKLDGVDQSVKLGESDELKVGQMAVAIGNPFGQEFTMTSGIVSALGRTIQTGDGPFSIPEVIQTDAPINPGNSGGPLLDRLGRVIGVNTQIISKSGASAGIGFAVPIDTAKRVVPALIEDGAFRYAWLGISGTTLSTDMAKLMGLPEDTRGALVIEVAEDGPAEQAGLIGADETQTINGLDYRLGGHVITEIEGFTITEMDDLIIYLSENARPGERVHLEVISNPGESETIMVTLGERPS